MKIKLEEKLGYSFRDKGLPEIATAHSSYVNECKGRIRQSNERLEFLGDSVLSLITAEYLYNTFPGLPEGKLTKIRAAMVCERSLAELARELDLGSHIKLGKGEALQHGEDRDSILADAFEALLAAVYIDGGIEAVRSVFMPRLEKIALLGEGAAFLRDYKTWLQEIVQKNREETLTYELTGEEGPDHNKKFTVEVRLNSNVIGTGVGHSKKDAEQAAAREALILMGEVDEQ